MIISHFKVGYFLFIKFRITHIKEAHIYALLSGSWNIEGWPTIQLGFPTQGPLPLLISRFSLSLYPFSMLANSSSIISQPSRHLLQVSILDTKTRVDHPSTLAFCVSSQSSSLSPVCALVSLLMCIFIMYAKQLKVCLPHDRCLIFNRHLLN